MSGQECLRSPPMSGSPLVVPGGFAYQPALDGLRALAVIAVVLFHGGFTWMSGGYVGVSVFFTLSGYLITSLALVEHGRHGRFDLAAFYSRRLRRLLPASLVCLTLVVLAGLRGWFDGVAHLRRDVWGAVAQVQNWVALAAEQTYADQVAALAGQPSPVTHYWSLAIEEQFYLVWPLALLAVLRLTPARRLRAMLGLTVASAVATLLISARWGEQAVYLATPARLVELLAGALLAMVAATADGAPRAAGEPVHPGVAGHVVARGDDPAGAVVPPGAGLSDAEATVRPLPGPTTARQRGRVVIGRRGTAAAGVMALGLLGLAAVVLPADGGPAYRGGFIVVAAASAVLIAGLQARSPLRVALSWSPLVAVGRISYGIYLFHWPVFVLVDHRRLQWFRDRPDVLADAGLFVVRIALTLAVAVLSYRLVERPLRARRMRLRRVAPVAIGASLLVAAGASAMTPIDDEGPSMDGVGWVEAAIVPLPAGATLPPLGERPLRVVMGGDSVAWGISDGMVRWALDHPDRLQISSAAAIGCGLDGRSEIVEPFLPEVCIERRAQLDRLVAESDPDVVFLMVTYGDFSPRAWDPEEGPLEVADPRFHAHLADTYVALTDRLMYLGAPLVVWGVPPVPALTVEPEAFAMYQDTVRSLADVYAGEPRVEVLHLDAWLAEQAVPPRRHDGLHFSISGGYDLADRYLVDALDALTHAAAG